MYSRLQITIVCILFLNLVIFIDAIPKLGEHLQKYIYLVQKKGQRFNIWMIEIYHSHKKTRNPFNRLKCGIFDQLELRMLYYLAY